ncbi:MAG: NAD(P)/FAD-dependent oxidoreductase [Pseudomonadota bacterium]
MSAKPDHSVIECETFIIGAGFSGIGLGIRLRQQGSKDFIIAEAAGGVGGTWWVNRYPGCACDVQSHLYSLSFAPNPDWTRHFPPRDEIQQHMARSVERFELSDHLRLNTAVTKASWNEDDARWEIEDQHGQHYRARLLISAIGGLSRPNIPPLPGLDAFKGKIFHSQQWLDDLALEGQRVAVIGGGASAIQFVPKIAPQVKQLDFYQRTPQWILPKPDRPIAVWKRRLFRWFPPLRLLRRFSYYLLLESRLPAFNWSSKLTWLHRRKALRHLARQIESPELRQQLTPHYDMGCKRVLMSNDFYPALNRSNVSVIDGSIQSVQEDGVTGSDGIPRPADILILATGFQATCPIPEDLIIGRDGQDLAAVWTSGPTAYKGSAIAGFPNFFTLLGPNTALGHNSVLLMIEAQINYVLGALKALRSGRRTLTVRDSRQAEWNQQLDTVLQRSVWSRGGCASWYLHPVSGRNTTLWPDFTFRFRRRTAHFDEDAYD